jgi:hypothetical protein
MKVLLNIKFKGLLQYINFIYSNEIKINLNTCIELYEYSRLFQIDEIVDVCKDIIMKNVEIESVVSIFEMAELYKDEDLIKHCL